MKRSWIRQALLAAVLGLGFSGLVRAGDVVAPKPVSGVMIEATGDDQTAEGQSHRRFLGRLRPVGVKERIQNHQPLGCYSNFNDYSCGSWHSECQFLFGSCRTFYGEACLKGPPPSPVPGFDIHALGLDRPRCGCGQ